MLLPVEAFMPNLTQKSKSYLLFLKFRVLMLRPHTLFFFFKLIVLCIFSPVSVFLLISLLESSNHQDDEHSLIARYAARLAADAAVR